MDVDWDDDVVLPAGPGGGGRGDDDVIAIPLEARHDDGGGPLVAACDVDAIGALAIPRAKKRLTSSTCSEPVPAPKRRSREQHALTATRRFKMLNPRVDIRPHGNQWI